MTLFRSALLMIAALSLTGCAGLFIAGATTTVNLVTDPRSTQEIWQDNNIDFEIASISNDPAYRNKARVLGSTYRGSIVLMGQAETAQLSQQVEQKAREVKGVKKVHNQVRIKAPLTVSQISNDTWITTKVKSALLTKTELNGIKIKVITEDSEVFLLGYVSKEHAQIASDIARNTSGVKQVILGFQYSEDQAVESQPAATESELKESKPTPVAELSEPMAEAELPQEELKQPVPIQTVSDVEQFVEVDIE
ncbi:hemolysin [Vibrio sp. 10N.286.49.B3]|uniref:BON domain-containing protein n=1 Tax=Vibrio sp. 10N.286.49.B3 TaxID=1880855 RepID=UPI000C824C22|nr:BON domain-containing protein [Vibrio sp. 10N.286.49.B3]PMH39797.1 hemolysin [Vibrio sp. 10N.286.49.B3]